MTPDDAQRIRSAAKPFLASITDATSFLIPSSYHIVSHLDADGLSSAAIIRQALIRKNIEHTFQVVQNVDETVIDELNALRTERIIFVDIGSGQLDLIAQRLEGKQVLILDHHEAPITAHPSWITQVNPHSYGLDGNTGISGAGVTYLYAKALDEHNIDLATRALVGAIGDVQERNGFQGLNIAIHDDAIRSNTLITKRGLVLFGSQTKPLVKLLAYNRDLELKDVTGSPSAAFSLLVSAGITPTLNGKERRYIDLTSEEQQRLNAAILMRRSHLPDPHALIGYTYELANEEPGTQFRCAREYATLLNACGRMDASEIGIRACMGEPAMKRSAIQVESEYKRSLSDALRWYGSTKHTQGKITVEDGLILIDGRGRIRAPIIGTLASIVSHMDDTPQGTRILSIATLENGDAKASLRIKGPGEDLRETMNRIAQMSGCAAGGHANAAGALIPQDKEDSFLATALEILRSPHP